jgi:hypothetical protein
MSITANLYSADKVRCDARGCAAEGPCMPAMRTGDAVANDLSRLPYAWSVVTTPDGKNVQGHHCPKHAGQ